MTAKGSRLKTTAPVAWAAALAAAGIAVAFTAPGWTEPRPPRFAVVEPDRIFRGGYPEPEELRWLAREHGVRSVVSLMKDPPDSRRTLDQQTAVRELGLRFVEWPMPGNGCGDFDTMDAAATAIADARDGPVYVHCAAGKQRSNAAVAAYRMRHCGWTLEQTLAELEEKYGLDRTAEAALVEHLEKYWRERIAPSRANSQNAPHATR